MVYGLRDKGAGQTKPTDDLITYRHTNRLNDRLARRMSDRRTHWRTNGAAASHRLGGRRRGDTNGNKVLIRYVIMTVDNDHRLGRPNRAAGALALPALVTGSGQVGSSR
ncbi:hypothetical protein DPEC_G00232920 [Dallia pectoralis]|uniref:Uncharacterized protein n=1 Tax=Dallia pectoralis TaxID=75939 RepID=A0ACC2FXJ3_DALPE|nr:hypothetical protein DPEC_G00232920 [Dallia pectoralis]